MRSTSLQFRVRSMAASDIPRVAEIEKESFPSAWPATAYKRELRNPLARYLVVEKDPQGQCDSPDAEKPAMMSSGLWESVLKIVGGNGHRESAVVGFGGLWLMVGEAHIVTLAVAERWRRHGLGEELLIALLRAALDEQQEVATLEVRRSNEAAQLLYRKYGFRQVGIRVRYYTDNGEDAVIMTTDPIQTPEYREMLDALARRHERRMADL